MDCIYKHIEDTLGKHFNSQPHVLEDKEPRAIGSFVEKLIADNFKTLVITEEYTISVNRKSMADISYRDKKNNYYAIDIKTHRLNDSSFNMPNLISIKRLSKFYEESSLNHFMILKVDYNTTDSGIKIKNVTYNPIEFYAWECLRIGALGWGQIQIANANSIRIEKNTRKNWMVELCNQALKHYQDEINKIENTRRKYFCEAKVSWK